LSTKNASDAIGNRTFRIVAQCLKILRSRMLITDPLLPRRGILITALLGMSKQRSPEMKMMGKRFI